MPGLILYGSGSGIRSIARGTVPFALFGRDGYAVLMGRLATPILVAQAASPSLGVLLMDYLGADMTIAVLAGAAVFNILLVLPLVPLGLAPADRRVTKPLRGGAAPFMQQRREALCRFAATTDHAKSDKAGREQRDRRRFRSSKGRAIADKAVGVLRGHSCQHDVVDETVEPHD